MKRYLPCLLLLIISTAFAAPVAPKKNATPAPREGQITLDGKLDEAAWAKAPEQTGFEMPLGVTNRQPIPPDQQTSFRVLYDDSTLYLGIRCNEPQMDKLTTLAARQHDAAMWSDDDVELFLDPVGDRTEYYQLAINSDGTQVDLYLIESGNTGKGGWSAEWKSAAFKGPDYWSVEVALPFAMFHNRPSKSWADNWVFSISRTRTPAPGYFSQYSPAEGYHDPKNYGTLGPIKIDKSRYNLYPDSPGFTLKPAKEGFDVTGSLKLENRGDNPFIGTLEMEILAPGAHGATAPVQLAPNASATIAIPGASVAEQGKFPVIFRVKTPTYTAMNLRTDSWFKYIPLTIRLTDPNYRNCIYATQKIESLKGTVTLGLPVEQAQGYTLRTSLSGANAETVSTESAVTSAQIPFELPCRDLAEGSYVVRAELLKPLANKKFELVAETEATLRKLPPAPAVEARVDDEGHLLVNGVPLFVRGWYGSLEYTVGSSSFPQAQLPHSTNFMMGASDFERTDMNLYALAGLTGPIDEAKAKLDQPLDSDLKAKLRAEIAKVRNERNIIGYYISDEPECRGLSPVFLKSLRDYVAELDPYRFCMIVSRSPAEYMQACDVMCPHPYMNPMVKDGKRQFGSPLNSIHKDISEARDANDGSKAVWAMPQTFTYGGLYGQHPNFTESRWMAHTAMACGAKGMVPFIFAGYWNHLENRIAMDAVFEELAFLAPAWNAHSSDTPATSDNPGVDVVAKWYQPRPEDNAHGFIIAVNQSYEPTKATITVPQLAKGKKPRLLVLRENRVVPVQDGVFTDDFPGLGVHIYTTLEVLPDLKTLDALQQEIAAALKRPADEGNLLAQGKVKWFVGKPGATFQSDIDLADSVTNAAAWLPVYDDRTQCVVTFEKPVTFRRVAFWTSTIKNAELDIWENGAWKTIYRWQDQYLPKLEYKGEPVTTDRLRIRPTAQRQGFGSWCWEEITEMGVYE